MAYSASFHLPTVPGTDATTTARLPAWVLLDKVVHIENNRRNATEARSQTSRGQQVIVSFSAAEPPGLSRFSVHCPGLSVLHFATRPRVVHTDRNLVLLSLCLKVRGEPQTEYFVYSAGSRPSLTSVQGLDSYTTTTRLSIGTIGLVALGGDDGEHFILAALKYTLTPGQYEVHVFRSEPGTWARNVLLEAELNAHGMVLNPEKVINLGGGRIGWVDLWRGILGCNIVDLNPALSFIPLPTLLPANLAKSALKECSNARPFRDVVVCSMDGGVIRCVERPRETRDVSSADVLHDSEFSSYRDEDAKEDYDEYLGWRIITWDRPVSSSFWHRGCLVHVDEILVNSSPSHSDSVVSAPRNLTLKELVTCFPTLSMVGSDVVYLLCKGEPKDQKTWAVTINMRNKTAEEVLVPFPSGWSYFSGIGYIPCDLSKYISEY